MLHVIKMWLEAPVETKDEAGKKRLTGGKGNDRGTPLTRGEESSRTCPGIRPPVRLCFRPEE